jgi:hypothetical protein
VNLKAASALLLLLAAAMAAPTGCSLLDPYPTYPQQPAPGVQDPGPRIAICYDAIASSKDQVQKAAQDECAPNTVATRIDTDWKLDYCPVLLPARATFLCKPKK